MIVDNVLVLFRRALVTGGSNNNNAYRAVWAVVQAFSSFTLMTVLQGLQLLRNMHAVSRQT
jgi:choline-glycine betaine transporter